MQTLDQMIHKTSGTHMKQETDTHKEKEEQMKQRDTKDCEDQRDTNFSQGEQKPKKFSPKIPSNTSVSEVDEDWENQLWEVVKQTYGGKGLESKPPIEEIDLEQKTLELEMRLEYGEVGSEVSQESKAD